MKTITSKGLILTICLAFFIKLTNAQVMHSVGIDINQNGYEECTNVNSMLTTESNFSISIFPNPNKGEFVAQISNANIGKEIEVRIMDVMGVLVYSKKITAVIKLYELKVDISSHPNGLYVIEFIMDKKDKVVKRVVKN